MSRIDHLDIGTRTSAAIRKAGLNTVESVLSLSIADIARVSGLSTTDARNLKTLVSRSVITSKPSTALDLHREECHDSLKVLKLSTGCSIIDSALRGGILSRGITEIAGESASGKTQLCLQLCLTVQLPHKLGGLQGGAAYICTEDAFPNKRLNQMMQYFERRTPQDLQPNIQYGDNIFIEHVSDVDELNHCIDKRLPVLLQKQSVKLLVIDSVAAIFRCEYNSNEVFQRSKHLWTLGAKLHALSHRHGIPVVCVNQVTDSMAKTAKKHLPALGLTWSNQITCSIMLERTQHSVMLPRKSVNQAVIGGFETNVRKLEVTFSPNVPNVNLPFVIDQEGIKGIT